MREEETTKLLVMTVLTKSVSQVGLLTGLVDLLRGIDWGIREGCSTGSGQSRIVEAKSSR